MKMAISATLSQENPLHVTSFAPTTRPRLYNFPPPLACPQNTSRSLPPLLGHFTLELPPLLIPKSPAFPHPQCPDAAQPQQTQPPPPHSPKRQPRQRHSPTVSPSPKSSYLTSTTPSGPSGSTRTSARPSKQ